MQKWNRAGRRQKERKAEMGAAHAAATGMAERKRVEAVAETLAAIHNHGESLGELAHDARNMVTALSLYCDLLEEPGVLAASHRHYGSELRLLADASRRLVEKLSLLDHREDEEPLPERLPPPGTPVCRNSRAALSAGHSGHRTRVHRPDRRPARRVAGQPRSAGCAGRPFHLRDGERLRRGVVRSDDAAKA